MFNTRIDAAIEVRELHGKIDSMIEAAYRRGYANGWRDNRIAQWCGHGNDVRFQHYRDVIVPWRHEKPLKVGQSAGFLT